MRLGVVSDVHANRVALNAVLDDMPPVDGLLCAGDVVGYGPAPGECVEVFRGAEEVDPVPDGGIPTVMGNHDRAVAGGSAFGFTGMARAGIEYAKRVLSDAQDDWLVGLPTERRLCDDRVKVVHGHPEDPDRYTYPREFSGGLLGDEDVLVLGHTHVQATAEFDEGIVVNPGSVGQPRDGDPRAAYAVLDLSSESVTLHRVEYDVEAVQAAIDAAGLPHEAATRLAVGR